MNDTRLFRKRPIPVTARQLTGDSFREIVDALTPDQFVAGGENTDGTVFLQVRTLEGVVHASENDWIVWGNHGGVWPVRGSIFAEAYEPVTGQPPTDRATVLLEVADFLRGLRTTGTAATVQDIETELRRLAAAAQPTSQPAPESCAHCGKTILRISGTLAEWWVHAPGGHTICFPEQAASSPRATPKPAARPQQSERPTVGYSGKGRAWCLTCPRPDGEDVPVTVDVLQPYEECAGCRRDVANVARDVRQDGAQES